MILKKKNKTKELEEKKKLNLIQQVSNKLFEKVPYSKRTEKIKGTIEDSLQEEYERELESKNEIQAAGTVMHKYGTIDDAGKLAGYSDDDILSITSSENTVELQDYKKTFRKARINIYLAAIFIISAVIAGYYVFTGVWSSLIALSIYTALAALFMRKASNKRKNFVDETVSFTPATYKYLRQQSDIYAKRFANSALLGIAGLFYCIFTVMLPYLSSETRISESFAQVLSYDFIIRVVVFLILKNIMCSLWIGGCLPEKHHKKFYNQTGKLFITAVGYWIIVVSVLLMLKDQLLYPFNYLIAAEVVYGAGCLTYNLTLRNNVVFKNININKKRITAIAMIIILLGTYQFLRMDSYVMQPYISTVSSVEYTPDKITYNESNGVYTITTDKDNFKILQLTDVHLGGSPLSYIKDHKALTACYDLIKSTKPDLVVVTGDLVFPMGIFSYSLNNEAPMIQFASFMRNIGIPWAMTYGNHDTEKMATATVSDIQNLMVSLSESSSNKFLYPRVQPDITGRSNQLIEVRNTDGSMKQALFIIDSNDYTGLGINDYDYIHDDQVAWYSSELEKLNKESGKQVPSMLFFHIPLQQYRIAYELYEKGSDEVRYYFGENGETMINKVCASNYPSKLFDAAKEYGTKAMFCGHDHYNNMSLEYQGIRLTYGMSIDYLAMPNIDKDIKQRGATLIIIDKKSDFDIKQVPLTSVQQSKNTIQSTLEKLQK